MYTFNIDLVLCFSISYFRNLSIFELMMPKKRGGLSIYLKFTFGARTDFTPPLVL